jgi:hypothetical protein
LVGESKVHRIKFLACVRYCSAEKLFHPLQPHNSKLLGVRFRKMIIGPYWLGP